MNSQIYTPDEPISSIATALAPAALGIVRVSGKDCIRLVAGKFSRKQALLDAPGNTIVYGWLENSGIPVDEVMVAVYRAPKSFTGEDMAEIFCHGGPAVVTAVHNLMLASGFRQALPGEYTFRAYINGKTDLTKAEAVREIIGSRTDASRSHAAGRLAGSLYREIDSIKKLVTDTLAAVEVEIEYPEDEETIADTFDRGEILEAVRRLESLNDSWKGEKLYQEGARVVLCGRTNAGKSSLFNALLKEERAIVSDLEGTTRDWIESWADFDGIPVRLFDTAGLRQTEDVVESEGVKLSLSLSREADAVLYVVDSGAGIQPDDEEFLSSCDVPVVLVWNKCDLPGGCALSRKNISGIRNAAGHPPFRAEFRISVKSGAGLDGIFSGIKEILAQGTTADRIQAGLGSARQKESVAAALESARHALVSADEHYSLDAVVQDLEDVLASLGEVTGDVTPDDVLGSVFSRFCVGK